ncbi:MAG: hypothetical protein ACOYB3_01535 [Azonexus sp.]
MPAPSPDLNPPGRCTCGTDPFDLVRVAVVVKYGGSVQEAAFKFVEEAETILKKYGVGGEAPEPTLATKLDALKAAVGEDTYGKLLANPEVERIASRAFRKVNEVKSDEALTEISAILNDAIEPEALAFVLSQLSLDEDPVGLLAEA